MPRRAASFSLTATKSDVTVGATTTSTTTIKDAIYTDLSGTVDHNWRINVVNPVNVTTGYTYASSDPTIATVSSAGYVTRIVSGTVVISVTASGVTKTISVTVSRAGTLISRTWSGWVQNSLAYHMKNQVDARIAGKALGWDQSRFYMNLAYNPSCWAWNVGMDLSTFTTTVGYAGMSGLVVSKRHVLSSAHAVGNVVSMTWHFRTSDGQAITRVGTSTTSIGNDIIMYYLDQDLPDTVTVAQFLPANIASYLPTLSSGVPIVYSAPLEANVALMYALEGTLARFIKPAAPVGSAQETAMFTNVVVGYSNGSVWALINDAPVAITNIWETLVGDGSSWAGPNISAMVTAVNNYMAAVTTGGGTVYTLQIADLSAFPTY